MRSHGGMKHLLLLSLFALAAPALAQSQARLAHTEGTVALSPAGDPEWADSPPRQPLRKGDRLWADRGSRAELRLGPHLVRMDGETHLGFTTLDDRQTQLSVTRGVVRARVLELAEGENFELDTPNLALRAAQPGDYRLDVDASRGTTQVTVHSGVAMVFGEDGKSLALKPGQQIDFQGRNLLPVAGATVRPIDSFDHWTAGREIRSQIQATRYATREQGAVAAMPMQGLPILRER